MTSDDGYTFTGFRGKEPIKFYYCKSEDKYLIGMRSDSWYYFEPSVSGWVSYASRHLPWGETVELSYWGNHTYASEPEEVDFQKWIHGILESLHYAHVDAILDLTPEKLIKKQEDIRRFRNL